MTAGREGRGEMFWNTSLVEIVVAERLAAARAAAGGG
jgi:hypothetical protein